VDGGVKGVRSVASVAEKIAIDCSVTELSDESLKSPAMLAAGVPVEGVLPWDKFLFAVYIGKGEDAVNSLRVLEEHWAENPPKEVSKQHEPDPEPEKAEKVQNTKKSMLSSLKSTVKENTKKVTEKVEKVVTHTPTELDHDIKRLDNVYKELKAHLEKNKEERFVLEFNNAVVVLIPLQDYVRVISPAMIWVVTFTSSTLEDILDRSIPYLTQPINPYFDQKPAECNISKFAEPKNFVLFIMTGVAEKTVNITLLETLMSGDKFVIGTVNNLAGGATQVLSSIYHL